jgi:hypothetical protein
MKTLRSDITHHDWWYMYSDDHRYYTAGTQSLNELKDRLEGINCPFSLVELRMFVHKELSEVKSSEIDAWLTSVDGSVSG